MESWESDSVEPVSRGAEASIFETDYLNRRAVLKLRSPKGYRHPTLDLRLRSSRTRKEARLLREARMAGVRTPVVYDIDLTESALIMERIEGRKVKEVLDEEPEQADVICYAIGRLLAKLHSAGITHGDLTTSNMILMDDGGICLFDLSLGESRAELEELGVDVHLFHRSFLSAHSTIMGAFPSFTRGYLEGFPNGERVMERVDEIRNRGRYT